MNRSADRNELRLRSSAAKPSEAKHSSAGSRRYFSCVCCLMLLCAVSLLKLSDSKSAAELLNGLDRLISSQVDIVDCAEMVMNQIVSFSSDLTGKEISVVSQSGGLELSSPVSGGVISEGFVESTHPLFGTKVSPRGVTITAPENAYVYSCCNAVVSSISQSGDTYSVCAEYDDKTNIVYNNLRYVYVKDKELIRERQIIGMLGDGEDGGRLTLEVWVDNRAVDPQQYLQSIENENGNEAQDQSI